MRTLKKMWDGFGTTTKLTIACIALYMSLYVVIDIAEFIGRTIALALM